MWDFEHIDNETSQEYFETAFEWYQKTPKILKSNWQFVEEKEEFIADLKKGYNYVGKIGGEFVGMVHGEIRQEGIIEGHLFCYPRTDLDFLTALIIFSKQVSLRYFHTVLIQVLAKHKTMGKIIQQAGFVDTGIRSWGTVYKGQLLEVVHSVAQRKNNER